MVHQFNVFVWRQSSGRGMQVLNSSPVLDTEVSVSAGQVNPDARVYLESIYFTSLQVVSEVCSWCYPRAHRLSLPPLLGASCLPGELRVRTAWFSFGFVQHSLLLSKGEKGWLHSSCGFSSCWHQAPRSQVCCFRATTRGWFGEKEKRGVLRSRYSSAEEGASNRSAACAVGLWLASSPLPVEARRASNSTWCSCSAPAAAELLTLWRGVFFFFSAKCRQRSGMKMGDRYLSLEHVPGLPHFSLFPGW